MKKRTRAKTLPALLLAVVATLSADCIRPADAVEATGGGMRVQGWEKPRIVRQSWNAETQRGNIVLMVSGHGEEEAMAWLREEYLPSCCQLLGVSVPADNPASTPPAEILMEIVDELPDGRISVDFLIVK